MKTHWVPEDARIIVPYRPFKSMTLAQTMDHAARRRRIAEVIKREGGWRDHIEHYETDAVIAERAALRAEIVWC